MRMPEIPAPTQTTLNGRALLMGLSAFLSSLKLTVMLLGQVPQTCCCLGLWVSEDSSVLPHFILIYLMGPWGNHPKLSPVGLDSRAPGALPSVGNVKKIPSQ